MRLLKYSNSARQKKRPPLRAAAASVTNVPRSLAAALAPWLGGALLGVSSFGWPLVAGGALKIVYDLLLFARPRPVRPEPVQLGPLVRDSLALASADPALSGVEIDLRGDPEKCCEADPRLGVDRRAT